MISTSNRGKIILDASEKAINLRQQQNLRLIDAVSVLDIAENLGVEVRFIDIPSMEGMYIKEPGPLILLTSLRPPGRLAFTCAHELGHHIYKHGTRVDELIENRIGTRGDDRDEFVASSFASFLLMPKTAINRAFSLREWDPQQSTPEQYFALAEFFGVGYSTIIQHMELTLRLINKSKSVQLRNITPKHIRKSILGFETSCNLVVVDQFWSGRAIDIQVGDYILLPESTLFEGKCMRLIQSNKMGTLYSGIAAGVGHFSQANLDWSALVRVSRKGYTGRAIFRFLEEPDNE